MADRHHRRAARGVQIPPSVRRVDIAALAAHRLRIVLQKISREEGLIHVSLARLPMVRAYFTTEGFGKADGIAMFPDRARESNRVLTTSLRRFSPHLQLLQIHGRF